MRMNTGTSSARTARVLLMALIFLIAASWVYLTAFGEGDGTAHLSWEEKDATHILTKEEASALTGVPVEKLTVVWSTDYSTEQYPVVVTLSLAGLDGLPIHVFEYMDDGWELLCTQTAPIVEVPVSRAGTLAAAAAPAAENAPAGEGISAEGAPAENSGTKDADDGSYSWILATAAIAAAGIAFALVSTRKKGP
ncbi:MAG: hypothetical protein K5981_03990 [Clostridia bacterium]|nr:hypothetical protein [Clostridia bacterium]